MKTTLTNDQSHALSSIMSHIETILRNVLKVKDPKEYLFCLQGSAGTGKSFLVSQIIQECLKKGYDITVTAPTHKALSVIAKTIKEENTQISTRTIHSFLGIKPFRDYNTGEERFRVDKKAKKVKTDILLIDESSMISKELYEYVIEALEAGFASCVLFVGDPYQLLPIGEQANDIFQLPINYRLNEIVRQASDNEIIKLARQLRDAIETENFIPLEEIFLSYKGNNAKDILFFHNQDDFLNDFYQDKNFKNDDDKIIASYTNKNVDAFNRVVRNYYWSLFNIDSLNTLREGDYLRFKEAYSIKDVTLFHNNQVVPIKEATKKWHKELEIEFWECKTHKEISQQIFRVVEPFFAYKYNEFLKKIAKKAKKAKFPQRKELWSLYFDIKNMFADVQYIYSSTIHKLQGSTVDEIYIDLYNLINNIHISDSARYRLVYVAVTRATNKAKIFMHTLNESPNQQIDSQDIFNEIDSSLKFNPFFQ